jgi:hypothetical protein
MNDKGLAQIGDNLINLCYSLAKSVALEKAGGEKVRDSVLARAIRSTEVYNLIGHRTDAGGAGDAYEAIFAWLWMTNRITVRKIVEHLTPLLDIESKTSRKKEGAISALAFQSLLELVMHDLPGYPFDR